MVQGQKEAAAETKQTQDDLKKTELQLKTYTEGAIQQNNIVIRNKIEKPVLAKIQEADENMDVRFFEDNKKAK